MATTWSAFDVIGPVMVGPSSSHTAGAVKIGYFTQIINGQQPVKVKLWLHGSFADVYQGHYTDVALVGGLLGMLPGDSNVTKALQIAKKKGMKVEVIPTNLGDKVHPNSVLIEMKNKDGSTHSVRSKSIGGGKVIVRAIDRISCHIPVDYSTIIIMFKNSKVSVFEILDHIRAIHSKIIEFEMNNYKDRTLLDVEIENKFTPDVIKNIESVPGVQWVRYLNHIPNYS